MSSFSFHSFFKSLVMMTFVICVSNSGLSQKKNFLTDSVHSARKATIYSAVLPGLGQAYNQKLWKVPLVYAAIGGCLTAAIINNIEYQDSRDELIFRQCSTLKLNDKYTNFEDAQLLELSDYSRKWRDNMFLFTAVAYMLNIVDANVDAHLFNFSVTEDLSMNVVPYTYSWQINKPVAGVSVKFSFR